VIFPEVFKVPFVVFVRPIPSPPLTVSVDAVVVARVVVPVKFLSPATVWLPVRAT
jgi:hypothetical protein